MARFDVRPVQTQRAEQRMVLQPRMLQSIEVLALPSLELTSFLAEKALENEALLVEEARAERRDRDETDWRPRSVARELPDRRDEILEGLGAREKTTAERAFEQVALLDLDPELGAWARFLVGCLDENGWLSATDAELLALAHAAGLEPSHDLLARAIACVQGLDPRGLGGRNAIEALLLQLDPRDPDYFLACRIVEEFLDDLSRNKRPAVAKALGVAAAKLEELIANLAALDPCPGRSLVSSGRARHPSRCRRRAHRRGFRSARRALGVAGRGRRSGGGARGVRQDRAARGARLAAREGRGGALAGRGGGGPAGDAPARRAQCLSSPARVPGARRREVVAALDVERRGGTRAGAVDGEPRRRGQVHRHAAGLCAAAQVLPGIGGGERDGGGGGRAGA
jgi:hypothetical protein